jgi:hypothetical protein
MLKEPEHFSIQHCAVEGVRTEVFSRIAEVVGVATNPTDLDLLDVVRPLLQFVGRLPDHARRTRSVTVLTAAVRSVLMRVHDPNLLLFTDLPTACGLEPFRAEEPLDEEKLEDFVVSMSQAVRELRGAYPALLLRVEEALASALGVSGPAQAMQAMLASRAEPAKDAIVEPELKAFVIRLADKSLAAGAWLESLATFLGRKTTERWAEADEREFHHRLKLLARRFERVLAAQAGAGGRLNLQAGEDAVHVRITRANGEELESLVRGAASTQDMDALQAEFAQLLSRHGQAGMLAAVRAILANGQDDEGR